MRFVFLISKSPKWITPNLYISWTWNLKFPPITVNNLLKFEAQDLENFFGDLKNESHFLKNLVEGFLGAPFYLIRKLPSMISLTVLAVYAQITYRFFLSRNFQAPRRIFDLWLHSLTNTPAVSPVKQIVRKPMNLDEISEKLKKIGSQKR